MTTRDLGIFIRKHRERARPEEAGFRSTGRRRTPGLRREELAQLCEVSPTWITWLEQGREVKASSAMLEKLSNALALTRAERRYLFTLAGKLEEEDEGARSDGLDVVFKSVEFMTVPAYILDRKWNVLAWNGQACELFRGWLDMEEPPNLLLFTFLSPLAKNLIEDWEDRAKRLVAEFRADCGLHVEEAEVQDLISELSEKSEVFAKCWKDYEVTAREGGLRIFNHGNGKLSYLQTTFHSASRRDLKLVLLLPA
ncbi:MAG TPA: helix-turn-helix transcriptional regulator [Burkholderiales bacterium]|nr:helix-turn-helix transcriptional regulator [Burkholderiales bacterium]